MPSTPIPQRALHESRSHTHSEREVVLRRSSVFAPLLEASCTAHELGMDVWDFAIDLSGLRAAGVTDSELRWGVVMGLVEHRTEVTAAGAQRRAFLASPSLQLTERSCFVLTPAGEDQACKQQQAMPSTRFPAIARHTRLPEWDAVRRQLRLGDVVIKAFKVPAANQQLILAAFQELDWPTVIDDPLPPRTGLDCKRRLHDTINSLNRNQHRRLLKFRGKGDGLGVCWEFHQIATTLPPDPV